MTDPNTTPNPTPVYAPAEAAAIPAVPTATATVVPSGSKALAITSLALSLLPLVVAILGLLASVVGAVLLDVFDTNPIGNLGGVLFFAAGFLAFPAYIGVAIMSGMVLMQKLPGRKAAITALIIVGIGIVVGIAIPVILLLAIFIGV